MFGRDLAQRPAGGEAVECLHAEHELALGHRSLVAEPALLETDQIFGGVVLRPVDDAEILAAAAFHRWLDQAPRAAGDELARLDHHALATGRGHGFPPGGGRGDGVRVFEIDFPPAGGGEEHRVLGLQARGQVHVPRMIFLKETAALTGEKMEGGETQVIDPNDVPAVVTVGAAVAVEHRDPRGRPPEHGLQQCACFRLEVR
jgi:hypothetical protein